MMTGDIPNLAQKKMKIQALLQLHSKAKQGGPMPTPAEFAEFLMGHGDLDNSGSLSMDEVMTMFDAIAPPNATDEEL